MIEVSWQDQTGRIDHEWRLINPLEIMDHRRLRGESPRSPGLRKKNNMRLSGLTTRPGKKGNKNTIV